MKVAFASQDSGGIRKVHNPIVGGSVSVYLTDKDGEQYELRIHKLYTSILNADSWHIDLFYPDGKAQTLESIWA